MSGVLVQRLAQTVPRAQPRVHARQLRCGTIRAVVRTGRGLHPPRATLNRPVAAASPTQATPMPFFPDVPRIHYEGPDSKNPLAFRHYNPDEVVEGKPMKDHLRFAVAYWHTFRGTGLDPFGPGTMSRPWEAAEDTVENAKNRVRVAFEFMEKLGAHFYCFNDRDVAPEGKCLAESNKNLDEVVKVLKEEQGRTGIQLLWG